MKLTPKQKEIIDKAIELEHGPVADEVFIRFVNDRYGYCFVFHKKGSRYFNAAFEYGFNPIKINLRTLKSLCEKGVLEDVDIQHNPYLIGIWYPETVSEKEIHDNGNCYHLSLLLKAAFPSGEICYAEPFGHTVFIYKEIPYDLEGVYTAWAEKFVPIQELEDQTRRNYVKH